MKYGAVIVTRNDNYGNFLNERACYVLNCALSTLDEVILVDWNSDGVPLINDIKDNLLNTDKLKSVVVSQELHKEYNKNDPLAQTCTEVLARNVGLRRLESEFLISTNIDVIVPPRDLLDAYITDTRTFYTTGMRPVSLYDIRPMGGFKSDIRSNLLRLIHKYHQQPRASVCAGDDFSLVSNCGDFQMAHRNVWYAIRGFEESLNGRGWTDTNVQRKAKIYGFNIMVEWRLPVFHIGHDGGFGGTNKLNDMNYAVVGIKSTTNPDTWGFYGDDRLVIRTL